MAKLKGNTHRYQMDIPTADYRRLKELAAETDTTVAAILRGLIRQRVEHRE